MKLGALSSAALMLSGVAGLVAPERVASALQLAPLSPRGVTEIRAGLGGTYAALGGWALVSRHPAAQAAVGVTWLGAAAARLASMPLDKPRSDAAFWAYLSAEVVFGIIGVAAAGAATTRSARRSTLQPSNF